MKFKFTAISFVFIFMTCFSQESVPPKKWLRMGLVYGYSSQNTYIRQDSDYTYESNVFKIPCHFNISTKNKHSWEMLVEPSYYHSQHESLNYWHKFYTSSSNANEFRNKYMRPKNMNEYVLNLGVLYRYKISAKSSIYCSGNTGPMYIDTDTERLKKGFAFSDIFALGANYKVDKLSFDVKCMIRHVSNLNFKYPNFGYNAVGFEFGTFYEFN